MQQELQWLHAHKTVLEANMDHNLIWKLFKIWTCQNLATIYNCRRKRTLFILNPREGSRNVLLHKIKPVLERSAQKSLKTKKTSLEHSLSDTSLLSKVIHQRVSFINSVLHKIPHLSKIVFYQRSSLIKGHWRLSSIQVFFHPKLSPIQVVCHLRTSHIKCWLPSKVVFHGKVIRYQHAV